MDVAELGNRQGNAMNGSASLKNMTAFITGGSGAIGQAAALALLRDGASILLMARRHDALNAAREALLQSVPDGEVMLFPGDACDSGAVREALDAAHGIAGRLDIVVATVGQGEFRPLLEHDADSFRAALDRNVMSAFLAIRYGAPLMLSGGSIVCISSIVATLPSRWMSAYGTAKAGLEGLVRAAAEELAERNIRVNAIRPGPVRSNLRAAFFDRPEVSRRFTERIPLGRIGVASDIGDGVRYLAGPQSAWLTGQSFAIDGGAELRGQPDLTDIIASERDNHVD